MATDINLAALSETDIGEDIPKETLTVALQSPPFVFIPGTFNTRDLGLITTTTAAAAAAAAAAAVAASTDGIIRPGFAYRSGGFYTDPQSSSGGGDTKVAEALLGKRLQQLGIRKIFDLRSARERDKLPDPDVPGVESVWVPPPSPSPATGEEERADDISEEPKVLSDLAGLFADDSDEKEGGAAELWGYEKMYLDVVRAYAPSFRAVLEHVRDEPGEGFLFHCTAGRDRTGVLAGLLLTLAGAPEEVVVLDYMLTRIGLEPAKERLLGALMASSMATRFTVDVPGVTAGTGAAVPMPTLAQTLEAHPWVRNMANLKPKCWHAFVGALDKRAGGFEGYVKGTLGFSEEDLETIKRNLHTTTQ